MTIHSLKRFHAFIGFFIGPFIFVAALTGALYGLSFSIENWFYRETLFVSKGEKPYSLADQIKASNKVVDPSFRLVSIRPASSEVSSSRVLYQSAQIKGSEFKTIFINPYTLEVTGDLITYGSGGAMPMRTFIDKLHRDLLLEEWGRWYSELAASWLWITGLSGLYLFLKRKKHLKNSYQKLVNKHVNLGLFCVAALLMLSVTGLTWSEWAGENISSLRTQMRWLTPSLNLKQQENKTDTVNEETFDKVLKLARENGINASKVEIKPPQKSNEVWMVGEIDRGFPTQVDAVAINADQMKVVDKIEFAKFPLMAKLTRWGIDLHMGSLFGLANQIVITLMSVGISLMAITGYLMWIKRKGWVNFKRQDNTLIGELRKSSGDSLKIAGCILIPISLFFPLLFVSFILFSFLEWGVFKLFRKI